MINIKSTDIHNLRTSGHMSEHRRKSQASQIHPEVNTDFANINFYYQLLTYREHSPGKGGMTSSMQKE